MKGPDTFNYRFLERDQRIEIYRSHLPHWRQEGTLYFVTFRLADSIPASVLRQWAEEDEMWRVAHGITPEMSATEKEAMYVRIPENLRQAFERSRHRRLDEELDRCHGTCPLRNAPASQYVAEALRFHHGDRLHCGDFVVMPNHVHWIVAPYPEHNLQHLCGSVKQYSATRINPLTGRTGKLWQHESFDHVVRNARELQRIRDYILGNHRRPICRKANGYITKQIGFLITSRRTFPGAPEIRHQALVASWRTWEGTPTYKMFWIVLGKH